MNTENAKRAGGAGSASSASSARSSSIHFLVWAALIAIPAIITAQSASAGPDLLQENAWTWFPTASADDKRPVFSPDGLVAYELINDDEGRLAIIHRRAYLSATPSSLSYQVQGPFGQARTATRSMDLYKGKVLRIGESTSGGPMSFSDETSWVNRVDSSLSYLICANYTEAFPQHKFYRIRNRNGAVEVKSIDLPRTLTKPAEFAARIIAACERLDMEGAFSDFRLDMVRTTITDWPDWPETPFRVELIFGTLVLNTDAEIDLASYGCVLSNPTAEEYRYDIEPALGTRHVKFDKAALDAELASKRAELEAKLAKKDFASIKRLEDYLIGEMDEAYIDLLRRVAFNVANAFYYSDPSYAYRCFRLAFWASLKPDKRDYFSTFERAYIYQALSRKACWKPSELFSDPAMAPKPYYIAYNMGCLARDLDDVAWLAIANRLDFPGFKAQMMKDPDLKGKALADSFRKAFPADPAQVDSDARFLSFFEKWARGEGILSFWESVEP